MVKTDPGIRELLYIYIYTLDIRVIDDNRIDSVWNILLFSHLTWNFTYRRFEFASASVNIHVPMPKLFTFPHINYLRCSSSKNKNKSKTVLAG